MAFHMPHLHLDRRIGYALLSLLVLAGIVIGGMVFLTQTDYLRDTLSSTGSSKLGRELTIAGPLDIHWAWGKTRVHAEQVSISNMPESKDPNMFEADAVDFTIKLSKLIFGRMELPEVTLTKPKLVLEKYNETDANWKFPALSSGNVAASAVIPKERGDFPIIGEFTVTDGNVIYRDAVKKLDVDLKLSTLAGGGGDKKDAFEMEGKGTLSGKPFSLKAGGGSLFSLRDSTKDYPLNADIVMGDTRVTVNGTFRDPLKVQGVDADLSAKGPNLADLYYLTSIPLPPTPAYEASGHLNKTGDLWKFSIPNGKVGNSDIKADGTYDVSHERGFLTANLESNKMYLDDLGGFIGLRSAGKETVAPSNRFFPDVPIELERMRKSDLDVHMVAHSLVAKGWPFQSMDVRFNLNHGLLKVEPITAGIADGTMTGSIILDGRNDVPHVQSDVMLRRLSMAKFFGNTRFASMSSGHFGGRIMLEGDGKSLAQVLGNADGRVSVMMAGGEMSLMIVEASGLDIAEFTGLLLGKDKTTRIRCAVGDFTVKDGLLRSDIFDFDTTDTNIYGDATIDLRSEKIDAQVEAHPKDASPLSARTPLRITGPLKHPNIGINPDHLALRGGAAAVLALLNPLAAIIPFVEMGGGEDSNCRALIQDVRARYNGDIAGPAASEAPAMTKTK